MANINVYGEFYNDTPDGFIAPASQIKDVRLGKRQDQINEELMREVSDSNTAYLVCSTPGSTAAKTIDLDNFTLSTNVRLLIKFEHAHTNTQYTPTLNIGGTGIEAIQFEGSAASYMNTWADGEVLDVYYDGTQYVAKRTKYKIGDVGYVECNTAAGTVGKEVNDFITLGGFELSKNVRVLVKMINTNTASNPTLNINGTGAKSIVYNGSTASNSNSWSAGEVLDVYYDGTNYITRPYLNVDNEPTAGSDNLVKSGGIAYIIQPLYKDIAKPYDNTVLFDNSYISQGETLYYHFTASSATGAIELLDENNQRLMRLGGDEGEYRGFVSIPNRFDHARVIYGPIFIISLGKATTNEGLQEQIKDANNIINIHSSQIEQANVHINKTDEYLKINKSLISLSSVHQYIDVNLGRQDNANYTCSGLITLQAGDRIDLNGIDPNTGTNCFDSPWTIVECDSNGNILRGLIRSKLAQHLEYTAERLQIVMFAVRTVAFIEASVTSSYISGLVGANSSDIINREKSLLSAIRELDNGYYNSYAEIDGVASLAFVSHTGWYAKKISVQKGDVFYITGTGGGTPLLWVNCTTANVVKAKSIQNVVENMERVEIVTDGYLVCNFNRNSNYALYKVVNINNASDYTTRLKRYGDDIINHLFSFGLTGIVHDWGFIGDSLMSGYLDNVNSANYEYSWAQRMCAILGVRGYNFSVGGMTAKWWIYNNDAQSIPTERIWSGAKNHKKQCYIIGLGVNDRAQLVTQAEGYYPIGDVSTDIGTYNPTTDTDTNAATFVGYYAGIIQRVRSIQPNAPIFVCTIPQTGTYFPEYNNAIKALAQEFASIYVIDFSQYANDFEDQEFRKMFFATGHMNALGYEWCAYAMIQMIDSIMRNNYNSFKDINMLLVD